MIDLKNSRSYSIQDRNSIQNSILKSINILNKIFKNSIEKEVEFSAGDEIQGLFVSPQSAYALARSMNSSAPISVIFRQRVALREWSR